VAFERVTLEAGERTELTFDILSHLLTSGDAHGKRVATKGTWQFWAGAGNERTATAIELL
jgi:hypothetical protein